LKPLSPSWWSDTARGSQDVWTPANGTSSLRMVYDGNEVWADGNSRDLTDAMGALIDHINYGGFGNVSLSASKAASHGRFKTRHGSFVYLGALH
jgi:hypothetical protein